jgi:hypothetical protein
LEIKYFKIWDFRQFWRSTFLILKNQIVRENVLNKWWIGRKFKFSANFSTIVSQFSTIGSEWIKCFSFSNTNSTNAEKKKWNLENVFAKYLLLQLEWNTLCCTHQSHSFVERHVIPIDLREPLHHFSLDAGRTCKTTIITFQSIVTGSCNSAGDSRSEFWSNPMTIK